MPIFFSVLKLPHCNVDLDSNDMTPLMRAAMEGNCEVLRVLLEDKKADPNIRSKGISQWF